MNTTTKPTIIPDDMERETHAQSGLLARVSRRGLIARLERLQDGEVTIVEGGERMRFGHRTARCGLAVTIHVRDRAVLAAGRFGGTVGAGESYIHGHWRCDDLTALVRIMVLNRHVHGGPGERRRGARPGRWRAGAALGQPQQQGAAARATSPRTTTWATTLYQLMLDDTMAYSCGIFLHEDATLHEASHREVRRRLPQAGADQPADHLVEIGTGWGGLAIHAAEHYGCRVTTTTISREQHDFAKEKIAARGLSDRITLLFEDYRDLKGQYDKLVSIEMIEAVGATLPRHLLRASAPSLLKPTGAMLLQAITLQDQYYAQALRSVDYIQRFIFPGSFIPSVTAITESVTPRHRHEAVQPRGHRPALRADAAACGASASSRNLAEVRALGYPDSFIRLWEFYLCYCEGGFAERQLGDVQMLLTKPDCRRAAIAAA